jgi:hypothetical protein
MPYLVHLELSTLHSPVSISLVFDKDEEDILISRYLEGAELANLSVELPGVFRAVVGGMRITKCSFSNFYEGKIRGDFELQRIR